MARQHTENLFRRFKGQVISIKTISGGIYEGRVTEVTNDFVAVIERERTEAAEVFVFFQAIESTTSLEAPAG
jgi:hypothetical protein